MLDLIAEQVLIDISRCQREAIQMQIDKLKFTLRRERLNSGGYNSFGSYFGTGAPLYWYYSDDAEHSGYLRASSREQAKEHVRQLHPNATFYN